MENNKIKKIEEIKKEDLEKIVLYVLIYIAVKIYEKEQKNE